MTDTVRVEFEAVTKPFVDSMRKARESLSETKEEVQRVKEESKTIGQSPDSPAAKGPADRYREQFIGLKESVQGAKAEMTGLGASLQQGTASFGQIASAAVSALNPILLAVTAISVGVKVIKKGWEFMKSSFKAFDPQGFAQTFGAFERAIKKLKTAFGALTGGAVKGVMSFVISMINALTSMLEVLNRIRGYIDAIKESLSGVWDALYKILVSIPLLGSAIQSIASFFGSGAQAIEDASDVISEASSAGLASFDKLNVLQQDEGDADEREELISAYEEAKKGVKSFFSEMEGDVSAMFSGIGERVAKAWDDVKKKAKDAWKNIAEWGQDAWDRIKGAASGVWDGLSSYASGLWGGMVSAGTSAWQSISSAASSLWDGAREEASALWQSVMSMGESAWSSVSSSLGGLWEGFKSGAEEAWKKAEEAGQWFMTNVIDPIKKAIEWIVGKIDGVATGMKQLASGDIGGVASGVSDTVQGVKDATGLSDLERWWNSLGIQVPGFASGSVVDPNDPFLAMLGDNASEKEVVSPVSTIVEAVRTAMASQGASHGSSAGSPSGSSRGQPIEITVQLDGRTLARTSYTYFENEHIRRGAST